MFSCSIFGFQGTPRICPLPETIHKSQAIENLRPQCRYVICIPSGDGEIPTHDPLLARQVLSQLSYTPIKSGSHLLSHTVTRIVPSAA